MCILCSGACECFGAGFKRNFEKKQKVKVERMLKREEVI